MSDYPWHWRIKQDGLVVASGTCPDRTSMLGQLNHYALVYSQDGSIDAIETRTGKNRWQEHRA